MGILEVVGGVLLIVASVFVIVIVLMQHGKTSALGGAISGGSSESFLNKKGTSSADATLTRWTRVAAIVFVALVVLVGIATALTSS